ncbi:MAG: DNRLRE domain-containing protein [Candidatus Omnitrophota bacterium]
MRTCSIIMLAVCLLTAAPLAQSQAQTQESYPAPVSEYAEKTGPNTMTFLAYPKYYKLADGALELVNTNLTASKSGEWDYEVTAGIWQLFVRVDGTFQARHEGDIFTYRFAGLGVGRGANFKPLDLDILNWENISVVGDSVRWSEVLPNVDVTVRYIHDILKVDVKVKQALMANLRAQTKAGALDAGEFLTARFEIPQALVTSQPMQNGEARDLYAEPISVDQPLYFEKNGKAIQKLRPVETYILDAKGDPIEDRSITIQTAQQWRLSQEGAGVAEMSARLGDLADAPDGDVVIDPSMVFESQNLIVDSLLDYENQSTNYFSATSVSMSYKDRFIIGFNVGNSSALLPEGITVTDAKISLHLISNSASDDFRFHKVKENWDGMYVTWYNKANNSLWTTLGGYFEDWHYASPKVTIPYISPFVGGDIEIPVPQIFKSHYSNTVNHTYYRGSILKRVVDTSGSNVTNIATCDNTTVAYRPKLTVSYKKVFGCDIGAQYHDISVANRAANADADGFKIFRYFIGNEDNPSTKIPLYFSGIESDQKVICVFPAKTGVYSYSSANDYASNIITRMGYINSSDFYKVAAIELGNEEEGVWWSTPPPPWWYGSQADGGRFADYYLAARSSIKQQSWGNQVEIISGGTISQHGFLSFGSSYQYGSPGEFIRGFIEKCQQEGNNSNDLLPDTLAIHLYTGKYSPEFKIGPVDKPETDMVSRLRELFDICDGEGYLPNFSITEFGFSPTWGNIYAPANGMSEYSQAVYYLRANLIHALHGNNDGSLLRGIGWKDYQYYQHPYNGDDTGMQVKINNNAVDRKIRKVAHELFTGSTLGFEDDNFKVITPYYRSYIGNHLTGVCAWKDLNPPSQYSNVLWVAVWRFQFDTNFWTFESESRSVVIDGVYSGYASAAFQFNFDASPPALQARNYTINVQPNTPTGKTTITITDDNLSDSYKVVNENPIFIKLTN